LASFSVEADAKLNEASATSKKDCKKPRSDACKLAGEEKKRAEDGKKRAHERLSQAKARDEAKAALAEAEARSATGPAEKREESQILTWLGIALTQLVALLGGHAASLIAGAVQARPSATPKPKKAKAPVPPTGGTKQPLPANVVPIAAARHAVKAWIGSSTVSGAR
jgi:hypothetical protein